MIDVSSLKGLTQDSRAVESGFLFAAFKGEKSDGRDYIAAAIDKGATVILAPEGTKLPDGAAATLITDKNPRKVFAHMVAEFYPAQPANIVAVTGTNGKTSTVHFTAQIWRALGFNATSIGTLQGGMTTADPVTLHKNLAGFADGGITHLAMEASSHGLHQYRLDGVRVKAAGFTNLSRDHLDYHADMAEYLAAKSRLFSDLLDQNGTAVINADTPEAAEIIPQITSRIWTYGHKGAQLKIKSLTPTPHGQTLELNVLGKDYTTHLPLVGEFQAMNALCALGLVLSQDGVNTDKAIAALDKVQGAPGRLQLVTGHPSGAAVYVDYAHTPDALENILNALRPHTTGKLVCLFGCGGDRDTGKRPQMGAVAAKLADEVIVTDDNPRSETPSTIRAAILAATPTAKEIGDRRNAITQTIQTLSQGDVLVVAGKGHEQGQIFATHTDPFDDVTEVQNAIKQIKHN